VAVVDKNKKNLKVAKSKWKIKILAKTPKDLKQLTKRIKIVVLATPPNERLKILRQFPKCQGVIVEKPIGINIESSKKFLDYCLRNKIKVQVNYWRRADTLMQRFAKNKMKCLIGNVQGVLCVYGNGIKNNGIHLIDLLRMLFGDVTSWKVINKGIASNESPITGDKNFSFALSLSNGVSALFLPLSYQYYRENSLVIYGTKGKLEFLNEGLVINRYKITPHRALSAAKEIKSDQSIKYKSTSGQSLYRLYTNLSDSIKQSTALWSSCNSAFKSELIAHELCQQYSEN
jgi:predicted dehydrogenase